MEDHADKQRRSSGKDRQEPAGSIKYEAVLDWQHYPVPRLEQDRLTSPSVADMYWQVVTLIRDQV